MIIGSRAEAEDLTQEAFTRLFERWETASAMDDPAGYLHRTAMNLFRNHYRRTRVRLARTVGLGPEQDVFKPVEDRDAAARALGSLAPRQRTAIVLTEALGYSGEEKPPSWGGVTVEGGAGARRSRGNRNPARTRNMSQ